MPFEPFVIDTAEPEPRVVNGAAAAAHTPGAPTHVDAGDDEDEDEGIDLRPPEERALSDAQRKVQLAAITHLYAAARGLRRQAHALEAAFFPKRRSLDDDVVAAIAAPEASASDAGPMETDAERDARERAYKRIYKRIAYLNGHMQWLGALDMGRPGGVPTGRPICQFLGKPRVRVARVVWERERGPIPPGARLKPTCDDDICVSPKHHALQMAPTRRAGASALAPLDRDVLGTPDAAPGGVYVGADTPASRAYRDRLQRDLGLCPYGHPRSVQPNGRVVCRTCDAARKAGRDPLQAHPTRAPGVAPRHTVGGIFVDDGELDAPILP